MTSVNTEVYYRRAETICKKVTWQFPQMRTAWNLFSAPSGNGEQTNEDFNALIQIA